MNKLYKFRASTVADPIFPRGGTNCKGGGANLLFHPVFYRNCIKMKKIGLRQVGMLTKVPDNYRVLANRFVLIMV